ncbi:MAG: helix-turn-helix domain, rpiR family protein [Sedimentibacter sp.]|jgi:DNA-binding MurR/RpiR family transcriptional regulator|nr:helix-turn-helix domain, rpiR family protein [Sedimentibacter sp.]
MPIKSGGLIMIKNILDELPESEKKTANFILNNPSQIVTMTVSELGDASETSSSAAMRLCKSLGLSGFQDLKIRILGDLNSSHDASYSDIKRNDTIKSISQSLRNNAIKSIDETMQFFNEETIQKSIEIIDKADTILVYGMGASFIAAKDAQQKFLRVNKTCYAIEDTHLNATMIANLKQNDLVIGISSSGETSETIKLIELANSKEINTIGITKYGKTSLGKISKYSIYTPYSIESPFRSAATASRMSQLYIIDVLFMCYATSKYDSTIDYLENTVQTINEFKQME